MTLNAGLIWGCAGGRASLPDHQEAARHSTGWADTLEWRALEQQLVAAGAVSSAQQPSLEGVQLFLV